MVALTIAGSDPSGGAGIQADLKTFHQFGVYGEAVLTLLTVQNTVSVERIETTLTTPALDPVAVSIRLVGGAEMRYEFGRIERNATLTSDAFAAPSPP